MPRVLSLLVLSSALLACGRAEAQSLRGSRASVERMYQQALSHDLHFYETSSGVRRAGSRGSLVRLSGNGDFKLGNVSHAYVLPATRTFVQRLGAQYHAACGDRMVVTSGMRPKSLRLSNSTEKSVHPTGMAIDLRKPRAGRCLSWLRQTLLDLERAGVIEATEEHRPPHFHVAVFPRPYDRYVRNNGGARLAAAAETRSRPAPAREEDDSSSGRRYKVRRGDSIWAIARRSRVSVEQIKVVNNLSSSRIKAGQVLVIPEAE